MRSFFKIFFASLLALVVFVLIGFFILVGIVSNLADGDKPDIPAKSVLVIDLSTMYSDHAEENPLSALSGDETPALYDLTRLIRHARTDENISGIYLVANGNANGFASSNEIRQALLDFRSGGKFVIAHGDVMSQQAYYIATAANSIYVNPAGNLDWSGFNVDIAFLKGTLEKLEIQPQIFYAGKFKSATEPFRTDRMTPENKLQTMDWLGDMYNHFLVQCAQARKTDTAYLHNLANTAAVQTPQDALRFKLIDGVRYDDEVKDEFKKKMDSANTTS
jgi:protease-4